MPRATGIDRAMVTVTLTATLLAPTPQAPELHTVTIDTPDTGCWVLQIDANDDVQSAAPCPEPEE